MNKKRPCSNCRLLHQKMIVTALALCVPLWLVSAGDGRAQTLSEMLPKAIANSSKIKAAEADVEAARQGVRNSRAAYLPSFDVTTSYGYEKQNKEGATANTSAPPREGKLSLTQLVTDFGKTNSAIDNKLALQEKAEAELGNVRQTILLDALTAYVNLLKAIEGLDYARRSEANIVRQTGMEEARVERGAGLPTDVLQAKSQLAGAQARRSRAEGALVTALNRYRYVFGEVPANISRLQRPVPRYDLLPDNLETAITVAGEKNLALRAASLSATAARRSVDESYASYFPKLQIKGDLKQQRDVDGTLTGENWKNVKIIKLELTYPFDIGFVTKNATLDIARAGHASAENKYQDTFKSTRESVENAYQRYQTDRTNAAFLQNQANISEQFLVLARRERELGRRSLLDILTAETTLLNAQSDAVASQYDVQIGFFSVLAAMGSLDQSAVAGTP